jgi:hypothetical protein
MLDQIFSSVKGDVIANLTKQTGLGPQQAEQAVPLAKDSISEGISGAVASGNIGGLLDMVRGASGGTQSLGQNMVYQGIASNFINKLTAKLGIPAAMAQTVSSVALPFIMSKIGNKTAEHGESNDIDQGSLMSVLGLDTGGMLGKAGDMLGGFLK